MPVRVRSPAPSAPVRPHAVAARSGNPHPRRLAQAPLSSRAACAIAVGARSRPLPRFGGPIVRRDPSAALPAPRLLSAPRCRTSAGGRTPAAPARLRRRHQFFIDAADNPVDENVYTPPLPAS
ncbi:ABC transporter, periplasmic substrate-binding domain protein [Burkholderia pseudomallei]|nr:ABC transporter, periplasmic substrate-binding domain protein [Burkholderia pseudomallei]